jgi:hypothetical protein
LTVLLWNGEFGVTLCRGRSFVGKIGAGRDQKGAVAGKTKLGRTFRGWGFRDGLAKFRSPSGAS